MRQGRHTILLLAVMAVLCGQVRLAMAMHRPPTDDKERLGMALEYFRSEKYREALLLFRRLDGQYNLNPRYRAYIGLCHYHLWEYQEACQYLDAVMPRLTVLAPHEQSVYYYANGESHFALRQYREALPCYERMLNVCHDNEKADALYRMACCYLFGEDWKNAHEYLASALAYYQRFGHATRLKPRLAQIRNMMNGCRQHFEITTDSIVTADGTWVIVTEER